jgi:hypothetical protein
MLSGMSVSFRFQCPEHAAVEWSIFTRAPSWRECPREVEHVSQSENPVRLCARQRSMTRTERAPVQVLDHEGDVAPTDRAVPGRVPASRVLSPLLVTAPCLAVRKEELRELPAVGRDWREACKGRP